MKMLPEPPKIPTTVDLSPRRKSKTRTRPNRPRGLTLEQAFRWYMPGDPPAPDAVWPWTGATGDYGHGYMSHEGRTYSAHRVSWMVFRGDVPNGLVVRHKNDTPVDVNPWNLELGTQQQNVDDMFDRGRRNRDVGIYEPSRHAEYQGINNNRSVLTEEQVIEIRALWETEKWTKSRLASKFSVSNTMVRYIIDRRYWNHI